VPFAVSGREVFVHVTLVSFGFKHGPEPAEYVFDVRFLPNPYWVGDLRPYTGRERPVADYVLESPAGVRLLALLEPLLAFLIDQFDAAGRETLIVAIGCTGGRHRSVALVEHLGGALHRQGHVVQWQHRDIGKE
jgi:UPF0042 nucleotide-binding protein